MSSPSGFNAWPGCNSDLDRLHISTELNRNISLEKMHINNWYMKRHKNNLESIRDLIPNVWRLNI